ncbi:MAG TPA: cytochrome c biogenesis protein CcdA [Acidimicrobiales bacterium]|nr:cytochrome c biogenesis protein CcdA [Acidimicrobiales bacterium]
MLDVILAAATPGLVVAFAAGMISFLSPCVLPLVPGYLSLMSGVGTAELAVATKADTRRLLRSTLLFVAGFTVVFVALGAGASAVGQVLLDHQRGLNQIAGAVVIAMGLALAGVVSPRLLQRERRVHVSPSRLGGFAAPVMGMAFAFGWTPCIGPVLASVLSLAATEATLSRGVTLLLAYSLGLGVPFVATGIAFGRLAGALAWVKRRARTINLVSGLLLAAFGVLLLTNRLSRMSGWLVEVMDRMGLDRLTAI